MTRGLTGVTIIISNPADIKFLASHYDPHPIGVNGDKIDNDIAYLFRWKKLENTLGYHFARAFGFPTKPDYVADRIWNVWAARVASKKEATPESLRDRFTLNVTTTKPGMNRLNLRSKAHDRADTKPLMPLLFKPCDTKSWITLP